LGINQDATPDEIKKAFRKLSKQYHPDKNRGNEEAAQKYLEVGKANDILSDPQKRQIYDIYGEEGLEDPSKFNR
jgi:DnaJ-class molecular chaperone